MDISPFELIPPRRTKERNQYRAQIAGSQRFEVAGWEGRENSGGMA
jgi:hypothetical protein